MKNEVTIIDLRNGDVFVKFGDNYAHIYSKSDVEQIKNDVELFKADYSATESWDNNEIEEWEECYESDTTDLVTLDDIIGECED